MPWLIVYTSNQNIGENRIIKIARLYFHDVQTKPVGAYMCCLLVYHRDLQHLGTWIYLYY